MPSGARRLMQCELDSQLRGWRHAYFAAAKCRQTTDVLADRFENFVWIKVELAHDRREQIPFDLHEREEKMFRRQNCMTAAFCLFGRAVDDATRGLGNLRW